MLYHLLYCSIWKPYYVKCISNISIKSYGKQTKNHLHIIYTHDWLVCIQIHYLGTTLILLEQLLKLCFHIFLHRHLMFSLRSHEKVIFLDFDYLLSCDKFSNVIWKIISLKVRHIFQVSDVFQSWKVGWILMMCDVTWGNLEPATSVMCVYVCVLCRRQVDRPSVRRPLLDTGLVSSSCMDFVD